MVDKEPFPKIEILPSIKKLGEIVMGWFRFLPDEAPDYMSEHNKDDDETPRDII